MVCRWCRAEGTGGRRARPRPPSAWPTVWGGFGWRADARSHGGQSHWALRPTHVPCAPYNDRANSLVNANNNIL